MSKNEILKYLESKGYKISESALRREMYLLSIHLDIDFDRHEITRKYSLRVKDGPEGNKVYAKMSLMEKLSGVQRRRKKEKV